MLKRLTTLVGLVVLLSGVMSAQPELTLETYGVSPRMISFDVVDDFFEWPYNGLANVGVGTMVYFKISTDSTFQNPTWTLPESPSGSQATFAGFLEEGENVIYAKFTPDVAGKYVIEFGDLGLFTDITLNAAEYFSVDGGPVSCLTCHGSYDTWRTTGHATDTKRAFNGELSSHFREFCLECHSTGYDANPTAVNGGFDDFPFEFPDSLYPGQYDNLVQQFPEAMAFSGVQCESCHGPGSRHLGQVADSKIVTSLSSDACGDCHDQGTHHNFPQQWDFSAHANPQYAGYAGGRAGCANCHNGSTFIDFVKMGGRPDVNPDAPRAITCASCHDPHDASNAGQLRLVTATLANGYEVPLQNEGRLCMNCHQARRDAVDYTNNYLSNLSSHFGPHHGPQADMLNGQNVVTWGYHIPSSPHLQAIEKACVGCHMGEGPLDEEGNFNLAGGHTFSMRTADGTANTTVCEPCHGDVGNDFDQKKLFIDGIADHDGDGIEEGLQNEVKGLLAELETLIPFEDGHTAIDDSSVTLLEAQGAYNYIMAKEDYSYGMHNPEFTVEMLKLTIGVLNGTISSVAPEDGQIPAAFELAQNYPNPFNPSTTIKFSIPKTSEVSLKIYDAIGREVAELVNEQMSAGTYTVDWNAGNQASGIYFYRIITDNNVQVKKMVLVK